MIRSFLLHEGETFTCGPGAVEDASEMRQAVPFAAGHRRPRRGTQFISTDAAHRGGMEDLMTIEKTTEGTARTLKLTGRLDTAAAPLLEAEVAALDGITDLTLDMAGLEYLSSAGLRVLLLAQKCMNAQGSMTLCHVNDIVIEVFELTGFIDILTIV